MARMLSDPDEQSRRSNIARFELFLEGTRRPELAPALSRIQTAAMKSALLILEAAGFEASDEQMSQLARVLNGLAFSNITFTADQPGAGDPAGLIDRLLKTVLG